MSALSGFRIQRAIPIYISTDGSCFTRNCLQFRSCTTCIVYVISSKIARLELASLFRESGCKGKEFFAYPPNFRGTFFEVFFPRRHRDRSRKGARGLRLGLSVRKAGRSATQRAGTRDESASCQASGLPSWKRVQKYALSPDGQAERRFFFEVFRRKKGKGWFSGRLQRRAGRAAQNAGKGGTQYIYCGRGRAYINKIWGGKKRNRMRATGKKDAGRLKAGCGQRGKRMWERGKGLAKGREKGWGKEGKVAQKGKKDG